MTEKKALTVQMTADVPVKMIVDIIITAMEQGCGYWTQVVGQSKLPPGVTYYDRFFGQPTNGWIDFGLLDDMEPCAFVLKEGAKRYRLDAESIQKGLKIMAEKYGRHFGDFMAENHDAETADVFLQCCLLGEIVYG